MSEEVPPYGTFRASVVASQTKDTAYYLKYGIILSKTQPVQYERGVSIPKIYFVISNSAVDIFDY